MTRIFTNYFELHELIFDRNFREQIKSYEDRSIFKYIEKLSDNEGINTTGLNIAEKALLDLLENEKLAEAS